MDEARRTALRLTLEELRRDRDRIDSAISVIAEKLGVTSEPVLLDGGTADGNGQPEMRDVGPIPVGEGEFHGLSQTKAAREFLLRAGRTRPQKTGDILAGVERGGVHFGGKDPSGLLYRLMLRDKRFRRIGTSLWGLDEWYPSRRPPKGQVEGDETESATADDEDAGSEAPPTEATVV